MAAALSPPRRRSADSEGRLWPALPRGIAWARLLALDRAERRGDHPAPPPPDSVGSGLAARLPRRFKPRSGSTILPDPGRLHPESAPGLARAEPSTWRCAQPPHCAAGGPDPLPPPFWPGRIHADASAGCMSRATPRPLLSWPRQLTIARGLAVTRPCALRGPDAAAPREASRRSGGLEARRSMNGRVRCRDAAAAGPVLAGPGQRPAPRPAYA